MNSLKKFIRDESGMGMVEIAIIIVIIIALALIFQQQITNLITAIFIKVSDNVNAL